MTLEYLDRSVPGWFALDVMRQKPRKRDWVALMVDVDPDDLKHCACDFPALFYVHIDPEIVWRANAGSVSLVSTGTRRARGTLCKMQ
jgi:hypothetical protein